LKTGVLGLEIHARDVDRRAPSRIAAGITLVTDHRWQGLVFRARPPRGWKAATLNSRAHGMSSSEMVVHVGNAGGPSGVFTGVAVIRMRGGRVDQLIARLNGYYGSQPTIGQALAFGLLAVTAGQQGQQTPEQMCQPFIELARQIVA
jgi:hypothetical protein